MNKFEFGRKDILAFAQEKNYTLNNVEKLSAFRCCWMT